MKKVTHVNYAFDAGRLGALVDEHVAFAGDAIAQLFSLPAEKVKVTPRRSGTEDTLQLTCYVGKSETDPAAMVAAAKAVLPHLRATVQRAERTAAVIGAWVPGADTEEDAEVLRGLAEGKLAWVKPEQRVQLSQRAAAGLGADAETAVGAMGAARLAKALLWLEGSRPRTTLAIGRA